MNSTLTFSISRNDLNMGSDSERPEEKAPYSYTEHFCPQILFDIVFGIMEKAVKEADADEKS